MSTGPLFDDGKDAGAMRTIGEVSSAYGIKPHVLRYWEQQFPMLQPLKRSGGRRLYRAQDVALVETIDRLVNREGYTLKGAKKAIQQGAAKVDEPAAATKASEERSEIGKATATASSRDAEIATQLRAIRDRLADALSA